VSTSGEKQLLEAIMEGQLFIVAEYRASNVSKREFVDKEDGKAKGKVSVRHLIEMSGSRGIDSVTLFQSVPESVTDPATIKIEWVKGQRYAFPLVSIGREKGKNTSGLLDTSRGVIAL
jgi:hypothetical protein